MKFTMAFKQFSFIIIFSSLVLFSACIDDKEKKVIYINLSPSHSACPVEFCQSLSQFAATESEKIQFFYYSNTKFSTVMEVTV